MKTARFLSPWHFVVIALILMLLPFSPCLAETAVASPNNQVDLLVMSAEKLITVEVDCVLVDGHRIIDNIYESAPIGTEFPIDVELFSVETDNGMVSCGKQYSNGLGVLLSGSVMHRDGADWLYSPEFDAPGNNSGLAQNADGDKNYQPFSRLSYREFTLTGVLSSRKKTIPTACFGLVSNHPHADTTDAYGFSGYQVCPQLREQHRACRARILRPLQR